MLRYASIVNVTVAFVATLPSKPGFSNGFSETGRTIASSVTLSFGPGSIDFCFADSETDMSIANGTC